MSDDIDDNILEFPGVELPQPLDDAFGLEPMQTPARAVVIPEEEAEYEFARKNIAGMIGKLEHAIDDLHNIARISEHPRGYEVLGTLMKNYFDANKDMMDLKKKRNDVEGKSQTGPTTVNNTLILTPDELLKRIKGVE